MNINYYIGIGRRKEATARVYLKEGTGKARVRTEKKSLAVKKIQTEIAEAEKALRRINLILSKQADPKTEQTLSVVKFETEEKLLELKKQLKQTGKEKGKELKEYFYMEPSLCEDIFQPLKLFSKEKDYDLLIRVNGSGFHSQAEAIRLGVSRALLKISDEYRTTLKSFGLLTRDPRRVEPKKTGQPKARKKEQYSKR